MHEKHTRIAILLSTKRKEHECTLMSSFHLNLVPKAMGFHASMDPLLQVHNSPLYLFFYIPLIITRANVSSNNEKYICFSEA